MNAYPDLQERIAHFQDPDEKKVTLDPPPPPPLNFSARTAFLRQKRAETTEVPETRWSGFTTSIPQLEKVTYFKSNIFIFHLVWTPVGDCTVWTLTFLTYSQTYIHTKSF